MKSLGAEDFYTLSFPQYVPNACPICKVDSYLWTTNGYLDRTKKIKYCDITCYEYGTAINLIIELRNYYELCGRRHVINLMGTLDRAFYAEYTSVKYSLKNYNERSTLSIGFIDINSKTNDCINALLQISSNRNIDFSGIIGKLVDINILIIKCFKYFILACDHVVINSEYTKGTYYKPVGFPKTFVSYRALRPYIWYPKEEINVIRDLWNSTGLVNIFEEHDRLRI